MANWQQGFRLCQQFFVGCPAFRVEVRREFPGDGLGMGNSVEPRSQVG
ncbi:hypothetical protein APY03_0864 [Variovorax sp. WDL1]|nr:hypothetical protein APY03_0864 [Variovorax sp. WDL1]